MADEDSILGGRLLGTKPVADAVASLGSEVKKLTSSLAEARASISASARETTGRARGVGQSVSDAWNGKSNWGTWGSGNGGNVTINRQAAGFGLQNAGIQTNMPVGMPGNRTTYSIYGNHPQAGGPGMGNGGQFTFGGAAGGAALAGGRALSQWGNRQSGTLFQSDLIGTMAYNNGGWANGGITTNARNMMGNIAVGQGAEDIARGRIISMNNGGIAGNTRAFDGSLKYGGILNPTMSFAQLNANQTGINSARSFNSLQMMGVSTISNGGAQRSFTNVAADILKATGASRPMNAKQIQASFRDQNSGLIQTLRSYGLSQEQIDQITNQGAAEARIMAKGGNISDFRRLSTAAGGTGDAAQRAQSQLESQYGVSAMQSVKQKEAASDNRNLEALSGFRTGVQHASGAVADFEQAIQSVLHRTGLGGPLGAAGGALSSAGLGAAVGAGLGVGAKVAGFFGARRLMGMGIGGGRALSQAGGAVASAADFGLGATTSLAKFGGEHVGVLGKAGALFGRFGGALGFGMSSDLGRMNSDGSSTLNGHTYYTSEEAANKEKGAGGPGDGPSGQSVAAKAASFSRAGTNFGVGHCQIFARSAAGAPAGAPSAVAAWQNAKFKHPGDMSPPVGAFVFWSGGSKGYGHVAISNGGGMIWSTDVKRPGKVDLVSLSWLNQHWRSVHYVGWSEDNNGLRVRVGGAGASGATISAAGGKESTGSSSSSSSASSAGLAMSSYGSINESDALSQALGRSGGSAAGSPMSPQGATDGPGAGTDPGSTSGGGSGVRGMVQGMAASRGWTGSQWSALASIIGHESGWRPGANNPTSSAFGLFQMLRETSTDPRQQTKDGLNYISSRYGDPAKAWSFWQQHHWYDKGAFNVNEDQTARVHKGEMIIPPQQAETIRQALMKENIPGAGGGGGRSGGVSLVFGANAINLTVQGSMDDSSARQTAKDIVKYISEDDRLKKMGVGR